MPATRTSSARPSTVHAEFEPYRAQPDPFVSLCPGFFVLNSRSCRFQRAVILDVRTLESAGYGALHGMFRCRAYSALTTRLAKRAADDPHP